MASRPALIRGGQDQQQGSTARKQQRRARYSMHNLERAGASSPHQRLASPSCTQATSPSSADAAPDECEQQPTHDAGKDARCSLDKRASPPAGAARACSGRGAGVSHAAAIAPAIRAKQHSPAPPAGRVDLVPSSRLAPDAASLRRRDSSGRATAARLTAGAPGRMARGSHLPHGGGHGCRPCDRRTAPPNWGESREPLARIGHRGAIRVRH